MSEIPGSFDVLIVGGGTSGAALAGIMARDRSVSVGLIEAGPDYGSLTDQGWPAELLDARQIPDTHEWGYQGRNHPSQGDSRPYNRARVIGGCSAHNGCVALLGHRLDYDHWAEIGNPGWAWEDVDPAFQRARRQLRVRIPEEDELTPFQSAFVQGAVASSIPRVADLNDPEEIAGVAPSPANIHDGIRWNTALAYLDPVRDQGNLQIIANGLVDRVILKRGRAVAVEIIIDGQRRRLGAGRIILAAGAYGTPAILLRSGVGPETELAGHSMKIAHELSGVGRNLADHPVLHMYLEPTADLLQRTIAFESTRWMPQEQTLLKARSSLCKDAFDLHLYAVTGEHPRTGKLSCAIEISCVAPRSTGRLTLTDANPDSPPQIDHGYLSDPNEHDLAVLLDGLELARGIAAHLMQDGLVSRVTSPLPELVDANELERWVGESVGIYYHPACSCKMGPASDPEAVVDPGGQVPGLEGLYICDASIFPVLMRANTNLPAAMVAEHMAGWLGQS